MLHTISIRSVVWFVALSLVTAIFSPAWGDEGFVRRITDCETLVGWSENAKLVPGGPEGQSSVSARLEGRRRRGRGRGGLVFDFAGTGLDLSKEYAVSFVWRVEGEGLRSIYVRLRNYPIADGLENLYSVWDNTSGSDPSEWQRATFIVSKPDREGWGREPDREARSLTFQARLETGSVAELFVDDIVVVAATFEWEVGDPRQMDDRWHAPVMLHNVTDRPFTLTLGRGDLHLMREEIAAGGRADIQMSLPETFAVDLKPLQMASDTVWAEVSGISATRSYATTRMIAPIELPPHPRLLFNSDGIESLKRRIERHDWARAVWDTTLTMANNLLTETVEIPPRGGNWWHWHISPSTGSALKKGKQIGPWTWEHIDSVNGEVFLGDPTNPEHDYDGVVIFAIHQKWAQAIRSLGLVYQVTGDPRYAEKVKQILLAYADVYPEFALHDNFGRAVIGGGKVGAHVLSEATWTIPVCQGADLVWNTLSEGDRKTIAENLLQPAARDVILAHKRYTVHNIQCWKNTAMGLVGFLLGDMELIWEAIADPTRGYNTQMAEGVGPGGMWWEGTWHYHWFTISALWGLTEAGRNSGVDLYGEPYKRMFDVPLRFAMPNWKLPAFNDGFQADLIPRGYVYELGYARYRNPDYLPLLAQTDRSRDMALWFGVEADEVVERPAWKSVNDTENGFAILARGEGDQATWLCLDYGRHGGGHGHPDKLGFVLTARGRIVGTDPGSERYGLPLQGGWYKTTLAHNTLLVDENPQRSAEGACLAFGNADGVDYVMADAGKIYDGVTFVRSVALIDENLLVFVDQVRADREHTMDIAYHTPGVWRDLPEGASWAIPDSIGYRYLREATIRTVTDGTVLRTQVDDTWGLAIGLAGGHETKVITATGVGRHTEDRVPVAIFRRRATQTAFGWCVALDGKTPEMQWLAVSDPEGNAIASGRAAALELRVAGGESRVLLANPGKEAISVRLPDGTTWETSEVFAMRISKTRVGR